jgi:hypothetical protein
VFGEIAGEAFLAYFLKTPPQTKLPKANLPEGAFFYYHFQKDDCQRAVRKSRKMRNV